MKEAAQKLTDSNVEVAVYPQGTRAWGLVNEKGERIDAGYYTTFTSKTLDLPRGHLKSGTAQLILDAALRLREKNERPLKVLFIGIDGTATVGPKGSFLIQTESEVIFRIGACWTVILPQEIKFENPEGKPCTTEAHENYLAEIKAISAQIDREMEKVIGRHKTLTERILKEPHLDSNEENILRLQNFLKRADATENILPFVVLDRIYALPASCWEKHLKHFLQLAWADAEKSMWEDFNQRVSKELMEK